MEKLLDDQTIVKVFNNTTGSLGIHSNIANLTWAGSDTERSIPLGKLKELFAMPGVRIMFERNSALIKEDRIREELGLDSLGKYDFDVPGIKALLKRADLAEFEDVLQFCSNKVLTMIIDLAKTERVTNVNMLNLIRVYSGIDLYELIKEEIEKSPAGKSENTVAPRARRTV